MDTAEHLRWPQRVDAALIVGYCTIMGYLCAYVFELGYLSNFAIPWGFARVTLPGIFTVVLIFLFLGSWAMPIFLKEQKPIGKHELTTISAGILILIFLSLWMFLRELDYSLLYLCICMLSCMSLMSGFHRLRKTGKVTLPVAGFFLNGLCILISFQYGLIAGSFMLAYTHFPVIRQEGNDAIVVRFYGDHVLTLSLTDEEKLGKKVNMTRIDELPARQLSIELGAVKIKR